MPLRNQKITPEDIERHTSVEHLIFLFTTYGFQQRPGGWECPHPEHRGGDSVSIHRAHGHGAWTCHSGSHRPRGGGVIEFIKLAEGYEAKANFPRVMELAASVVGLTPYTPSSTPSPTAVSTRSGDWRREPAIHKLWISDEEAMKREKLYEDEYRTTASNSRLCRGIATGRGWSVEALEHLNVSESLRNTKPKPGRPPARFPVMRWPAFDLHSHIAGWKDRTPPKDGKSAKLTSPGKQFPVVGLPREKFTLGGRHVVVFEGESDFTSAVCGMLETGATEAVPVSVTGGAHTFAEVAQALTAQKAIVTVIPDRDDAGRAAWKKVRQLDLENIRCCYPPEGDYEMWAKGVGWAAAWEGMLGASDHSALSGKPEQLAA